MVGLHMVGHLAMTIDDDTIDSAVIENLSQRVAEQQAEIESLTAKLDAAKIELTTRKERGGECHKLLTAAGIPDNHGQGKHLAGRIQMLIARAEAAEAKLSTIREGLDEMDLVMAQSGQVSNVDIWLFNKVSSLRSLSTKGGRDE
jgi:multidrug resistance efflux pump